MKNGYRFGLSAAVLVAAAGAAPSFGLDVITTLSGTLVGAGGGGNPDTILGFFEDGVLLATDDDGSPLGDGLASALFGVPIRPGVGTLEWAVSGFADFGFTGAHSQTGAFDLFIDYFDAAGGALGGDVRSDTFTGAGEVFRAIESAPAGAVTADLVVDNDVGGSTAGTVDFFTVGGLVPGSDVEVEVITAAFDSILGEFTGGTLGAVDDDGGVGLLSQLFITADAGGSVEFAITAFADFGFTGDHTAGGPYTIEVRGTAIPAPSSLALLGLGGLFARRRRR